MVTTQAGWDGIRTRVDGGVGLVIPYHRSSSDNRAVLRQTLNAVANHVRNPAVQTIVLADFGETALSNPPSTERLPADVKLAELCHEVSELVFESAKTLVFRRQACAYSELPVYLEPLTERERQILSLACDGASARAIAEQLYISERTVESHVSNGYRKLGIHSRVELVRRAAEFGL